jgi:hypothetical protein
MQVLHLATLHSLRAHTSLEHGLAKTTDRQSTDTGKNERPNPIAIGRPWLQPRSRQSFVSKQRDQPDKPSLAQVWLEYHLEQICCQWIENADFA